MSIRYQTVKHLLLVKLKLLVSLRRLWIVMGRSFILFLFLLNMLGVARVTLGHIRQLAGCCLSFSILLLHSLLLLGRGLCIGRKETAE